MNTDASTPSTPPGRADRQTALFTGLVLQQANLAAMFLGRAPHPDTGRTEINLEAASLFIDTLEALQVRTRGNLSPDEAALLADALTDLRLAFVQAAQAPSPPPASKEASTPAAASASAPAAHAAPTAASAAAAPSDGAEDEAGSRKRFVKRY